LYRNNRYIYFDTIAKYCISALLTAPRGPILRSKLRVNDRILQHADDRARSVAIIVDQAVPRARHDWRGLDEAGYIEEPDPDNGKNGFRVPSAQGRSAHAATDFRGIRMRSKYTRDMFHPALPDPAWNAFTVGDYDTAIFEAFKSLEVAVRTKGNFGGADFGAPLMKRAFDPDTGPLRDKAALRGRRVARCELFTGAFGEIRNPKGHNDATITDAVVAAEELMAAGVLRRIVDSA
jgi:hypothetical protein